METLVVQDWEAEAQDILSKFEKETGGEHWRSGIKPEAHQSGKAILKADPQLQFAVMQIILADRSIGYSGARAAVLMPLLRRDLPYTAEPLERILSAAIDKGEYYGHWSLMLKAVQRYAKKSDLTPGLRHRLQQMHDGCRNYGVEGRKFKAQIAELLGVLSLPDAGTAWPDATLAEIAEMDAEPQAAWSALFVHVGTAEHGKPSAKWLATGEPHRLVIGTEDFILHVTDWMNKVTAPRFDLTAPKEPVAADLLNEPRAYDHYLEANRIYTEARQRFLNGISDKNIAMLKGLAWYAADIPSGELARALGHMCEIAFQSVRELGAWAKTAGNAAIWALGQMPNGVGVGPLARLRTKLRDRGALKLITASIETAAAKAGMTVDELEDIAVPTGGLDANGTRHETFGEDGKATLTLDAKNAKTNLQWFGADGKPRKALPAAVKANFAAEVNALKVAEDEVKQALSAQAARLDRALLDERAWNGAEWRERYLSHPILGSLTRRLIWTFDGHDGLPTGNQILTASGNMLPDLRDDAVVRLWHPIGHTPAEVLRWRDALEVQGIVQPFKQAHREVYLLTDAEQNTHTYSNRFAAHILKQHQFNSLAVLRGWKNSLRLMVDDSYPPATKLLPQHNLRAEFWVEGIGDDYGTDTNETGTYLRLVTDQVRFYALDAVTNYAHAGGGGYAPFRAAGVAEALPLEQIPPLVLSEVMRDVDLFVGVASLGNDPSWADGGPQGRFRNYWQEYSFGDLTETAKTRADVLTRLLPRLKIADRCRLDGKFLVVRGDRRTYKIHLGSGNILMEPNDQYLCIAPKSGTDEIGGSLSLPFEGDRMLSVIVSKAFLLAADTRITDPTITRQIGVK